jgi:proline iminopeptidase
VVSFREREPRDCGARESSIPQRIVRPAGGSGQPSDHDSGLMIFMKVRAGPGRRSGCDDGARCSRYHRRVPALPTLAPPPASPAQDTVPITRRTLDVGEGHVLHVEEHGRDEGLPALVLHGGPGSGSSPLLRRGFDPARYRMICPDQRGAGLSRPRGGTAANDTGRLLADLRGLRAHLGIDRWLVVGGSWGATLALLHAADAPDAVAGLLLRGSFLARDEDISAFLAPLGEATVLARRLAGADRDDRHALALAWWRREQSLSGGAGPAHAPQGDELDRLVGRYRIQAHYLAHGCWLGSTPLLDRCAQVPRVPTLLLHGRDDRICPPAGAQRLHAALPGSRLRWIDAAGHDPSHPAMAAAMAAALDEWARLGTWADAP